MRPEALSTGRRAAAAALAMLALAGAAGAEWQDVTLDLPAEWKAQFEQLQQLVNDHQRARARGRVDPRRAQAYQPEALIRDSDRDPADVVLRRTRALLTHLERSSPPAAATKEAAELESLAAAAEKTPVTDAEGRYRLYAGACRLRRAIAFRNGLLDFGEILFVKRRRPTSAHMCDQYDGRMALPGGGLFVLAGAFGPRPRIRNVLAESVVQNGRLKGRHLVPGAFETAALDYDGRTIAFAYVEQPLGMQYPLRTFADRSGCYHVFRVDAGGAGLRQLTEGEWDEFSPCWLPGPGGANGRIVFLSTRAGSHGRCFTNLQRTFVLHSMNADGADLTRLSFHETNEWQPSVSHDGAIVYTRWDYVDRDSDIAQHPWVTTPDGRNARAIHGNYPRPPFGRKRRPYIEIDARPIPVSRRFVATAAPHHGQGFGSFVVLDADVEDDDEMSQLKRLTPDVLFPESEATKADQLYGTSWPLSEDFHLCVYSHRGRATVLRDGRQRHVPVYNYGLYLLDGFGNRVLLYRDEEISCYGPIPLRPRPRPPVLPRPAGTSRPEADLATVACVNVYDGLLPWPAGTKITALRIIELFPKTTPFVDVPRIGIAKESLARGVLGTVPVEADGSAHFLVPAGRGLYFQALDRRGLAVQSMRSLAYFHAGELLVCQGCHERRHRAPAVPRRVPLALRRAASAIQPDVSGSNPMLYPLLVQGVLDRHCTGCHGKKPKAPDLSGRIAEVADPSRQYGWSQSYLVLSKLGYWLNGGNGGIRDPVHGGSRTTPGQFGASAADLFKMLQKGHHDMKLPPADLHRITLWLECNSNFYGAYHDTERQARGTCVAPRPP